MRRRYPQSEQAHAFVADDVGVKAETAEAEAIIDAKRTSMRGAFGEAPRSE